MKLSTQTRAILENYAKINESIIIHATKPGSNDTFLATRDKNTTIIAQTLIQETFEHDVCIPSVSALNSAISGYDQSEITLEDGHLLIDNGVGTVKITYGDPLTGNDVPKKVVLPAAKFTFELKEASLKYLMEISTKLSLPTIKLYSTNGTILLEVSDRDNASSNAAYLKVATGDLGGHEYFFQKELLKMIVGDYQVSIVPTGKTTYSLFKSVAHTNLEYIIGLSV